MKTTQFTRTQYLNKQCTHAEYYGQYVNASIRSIVLSQFGINKLKEAFEKDQSLNSIPLDKWDRVAGFVTSDGKMKENGDYLTLAGQICILKEAARQVIKLENKEA